MSEKVCEPCAIIKLTSFKINLDINATFRIRNTFELLCHNTKTSFLLFFEENYIMKAKSKPKERRAYLD